MMLKSDPDERPTAREALSHQWFNNDKDIIRDLLQMNDVMCDEQHG